MIEFYTERYTFVFIYYYNNTSTQKMNERSTFSSKLGVIAATVGSAVGLGNIWRFPYETGQNGGAAFLLVYVICVIMLGIPVMIAEFIIGRGAKANSNGAFKKLAPGTHWNLIGLSGIFAAIFILGFYSVIAGWTLEYVYQAITDQIGNRNATDFQQAFTGFTTDTFRPLIWLYLFLFINYYIVSRGVKNGIEKASNILTPLLFIILIVFCIRSLSLPGTKTGLTFLFHPDFSKIDSSTVLRAVGQAFFSMSIGMGTIITYASYFSNKTRLPRTAYTVAALDTIVAVLAGILIFPVVFTFGINPSQGPELVFITLPNIFQQMPGAYIWSILFFLLLSIAALTSTISLCEVATAYLHEEFHLSRKRATQVLMGIVFITGTLCSLSFGPLSDIQIFGLTIFNLCDFTASNILMPLGGMMIAIFVGWKLDKTFVYNEVTNHGEHKSMFYGLLIFCLKYIAPIAIFLIFLSGLKLI